MLCCGSYNNINKSSKDATDVLTVCLAWRLLHSLLFYLEELIGYPAHTRLISPSVCLSVCPEFPRRKLDFQEKTITINKILLPMRNIVNLQLKPRITRALRENTWFAQEPISTCSATKHVVKILDARYEKADLLAIIRENCSHLTASDREKLLSMLLKFELLFDGTWGDWKLPPVSFELKEGMKPYHGRPYPIPHKHKAILMKEIKRLCNIGVLEWQPSSQW
jgi:hypothetical protein